MKRHELLTGLHAVLQPRTYLEIGVNDGTSLSLTSAPTVAIDPAFAITKEVQADLHLAHSTSDEFFAREQPLAHLPMPVLDLAFIDGMHLAEYALRDFINVERYTTATSVVVFDDMLPRSVDEAARDRHTSAWTGDVYKAVAALRAWRPDLIVLEMDTAPTGTAVVLLPDARSAVLARRYDQLVTKMVTPDPQDVPAEVLGRTRALDPARLLDSPVWRELRGVREGTTTPRRPQVARLYDRYHIGPTPP